MRFEVPQFIEREPKIVGPFTFKQFGYIGLAGALVFVLYFLVGKTSLFLFILLAMPVVSGGIGLAFVKINGSSLPVFLFNAFQFSALTKMYMWHKKIPAEVPMELKKTVMPETPTQAQAKLSRTRKSKMQDLANQVDIS